MAEEKRKRFPFSLFPPGLELPDPSEIPARMGELISGAGDAVGRVDEMIKNVDRAFSGRTKATSVVGEILREVSGHGELGEREKEEIAERVKKKMGF